MSGKDGVVDVLIDTDVSAGLPERDVDDALALAMALNSPGLKVRAITLTYGNDTLPNVSACMERLNEFLRFPEDAIAAGASSERDLGQGSAAAETLVRELHAGPRTVVAIGPLTNVATAVMLSPEAARNIEAVVVVAGRRPGSRFLTGNFPLSHPDLNFEKDPEAMRVLIRCGVKIVLAPFEVSSKVWVTAPVLDEIEANGTALSAFLARCGREWLSFWQKSFSTRFLPVPGFNPFDCLAVAWLTDRELLKWERADLCVEAGSYDNSDSRVQGSGSGKKMYLHARAGSDAEAIYLFDVEREAFLERLIPRLR